MILLGVHLAFASDALATVESEQQAIFDKVAPSVVYMVTPAGLGAGFFVATDGLILTAAHVVQGGDDVEVIRIDGSHQTGHVVERAEGTDLALVDTNWTQTPALKLSDGRALRVGSWIASIGHGEGGGWTFTTGMVTNIYPAGNEHPVFQTQIPLNPGNSGGPVVDRYGDVVGIVNAGIPSAQAINFATRADVALRTLTRLGGACDCLVISAPTGVPVFVDGAMVGMGPRVVVSLQPGKHNIFVVVGGTRIERVVTWPGTSDITLGN